MRNSNGCHSITLHAVKVVSPFNLYTLLLLHTMASIYLHIPFCKQRCIYCDFYFVTTHRSTVPFVNALNKEIMHQAQFYGSAEPIDTIYFGGGTPSLLTVEQVHSILETVSSCYDTSPVREITFELNPDDVDITYLTALRNTGVNRLSIGVQSFFDDDLQWMHRAHSSEQARNILEWAYAAGFDNFSVDLIFGLPTQSFSTWVDNLGLLVGFRPAHISTYSLTVEPRTPLYKRVQHNKEHVVSDEMMARLYRETMQILLGEGYEHYEVSSFALPGFRSMHNQSYWAHNNYLGFGPSAHSFWAGATGEALRWGKRTKFAGVCRLAFTRSNPCFLPRNANQSATDG